MRFMIIVKATADTEAAERPSPELQASMASYQEDLVKAGVLLDGSGLQPSSKGWRIRHANGERTVIEGPFQDARGMIAGYTLIQVRSREEAMEWTRRFPSPAEAGAEAEIEVRQLFELEDFAPGEAVERFRDLGAGGA